MEYFNNILCVEAQELISYGVMTESVYRNMTVRKQVNVVRRGCRNTPALVAVDSLPSRYYQLLVERIGDPKTVTPKQTFADRVVPDPAAYQFFITYRTVSGEPLKDEYVQEYCRNAEVLNALKEVLQDKRAARGVTGGKRTGFWEKAAETLAGLKAQLGHTLPENPARLRQKYMSYLKDSYSTLVSRKFGNANSLKVNDSIRRLVLSLFAMPNKPYSSDVHDLYMQFLGGAITVCDTQTGELFDRSDFMDEEGNPIALSKSTIWNILKDPFNQTIVSTKRMSGHDYSSTVRPYHIRFSPNYSFSKVSMDDRDLPHKMHNGNYVKSYSAYDVCSEVMIGVAYSKKKDTLLFIDCMRDMMRFIDMHNLPTPCEIEVENHIANQFEKDTLKAGVIFPLVQWCNPGNSQQKRSEHMHRRKKYGYEKKYQVGIGRWYAKQEANRTVSEKVFDEDNNHYKEKTYSYEEIIADDRKIIALYNNDLHSNQKKYPGKTRMQVLMEHLNPNAKKTDPMLIARYVGEYTHSSIRRGAYVRVQYQDYRISSPDVIDRLRPNDYEVDAYYMPSDDIDTIYIFQNNVYIDTCHKVIAYNEATAEQTDADRAAYQEQAKYVAQFDKMVKEGKKELAKVTIIENKDSSNNEELGVRKEELSNARRDVACYVSSTNDEPTDEEEFDYADCLAWAKQAAIKSL